MANLESNVKAIIAKQFKVPVDEVCCRKHNIIHRIVLNMISV
jgi:hypothetical protein